MQIQENKLQASEYLRQVIPLLSKHALTPTPINYAVFYSYVSGASQALNDIIDTQLSQKKTFTVALMLELYEQYVNGKAIFKKQDEVQDSLNKIMGDASEEISQVSSGANEFDSSLCKHAEQLTTASDPDTTALILKQIMQDTRQMVKSNQEAQAKMEQTQDEIQKIKEKLEQTKEAANNDALTGLKNRGAFNQKINEVINDTDNKHSLIMFDIDHFKRVNDSFGHLVGDRVIRYVSALLKQVMGENGFIARYGGEEFVVLLENKNTEESFKLAEKVRVALGNSKLQRKESGETIGKITISAGITLLNSNDTSDSFIERADQVLYKAKKTGRDKTIVDK